MLNQKGFATIEVIPFVIVTMVIVGFGLGFFGAVHTAIIANISARSYAFETFRNRSTLYTLRDLDADQASTNYFGEQYRIHGSKGEGLLNNGGIRFSPFIRPVSLPGFPFAPEEGLGDPAIHHNLTTSTVLNQNNYADKDQREQFKVNPIWVRVRYGICLSLSCGD